MRRSWRIEELIENGRPFRTPLANGSRPSAELEQEIYFWEGICGAVLRQSFDRGVTAAEFSALRGGRASTAAVIDNQLKYLQRRRDELQARR